MIRPTNDITALSKYEVRLGHSRVTVEAASREQALVAARRLLAEDMPRMWDKIYSLEESRFEIETKQ